MADPLQSIPTMEQRHAERYLDRPATVFLESGVKLSGSITEVDAVALILTRDGVSQSVFYRAIATIMPSN